MMSVASCPSLEALLCKVVPSVVVVGVMARKVKT